MRKKQVLINLSPEQANLLRLKVFRNIRLSGAERRRAVSKEVHIPSDGSPVALFCEGHLVGEV